MSDCITEKFFLNVQARDKQKERRREREREKEKDRILHWQRGMAAL